MIFVLFLLTCLHFNWFLVLWKMWTGPIFGISPSRPTWKTPWRYGHSYSMPILHQNVCEQFQCVDPHSKGTPRPTNPGKFPKNWRTFKKWVNASKYDLNRTQTTRFQLFFIWIALRHVYRFENVDEENDYQVQQQQQAVEHDISEEENEIQVRRPRRSDRLKRQVPQEEEEEAENEVGITSPRKSARLANLLANQNKQWHRQEKSI